MQPITIALPDWIDAFLAERPTHYPGDGERMRLALDLARANVTCNSGGPFGAALFAADNGKLLGVGVNLVVHASCSIAHAEMDALAATQQSLGSHDLGSILTGGCVLACSAEPCAMCLGALGWTGISRLICAARDGDVRAIGFDEGDKPRDWPTLLARRGISLTRDLMRTEAIEILNHYAACNGVIYGPTRMTAQRPPN